MKRLYPNLTITENTKLYIYAKHIILFITVIIVAINVNAELLKCDKPPIGGLIAGILLGIFWERAGFISGALFGLIISVIFLAVKLLGGMKPFIPAKDELLFYLLITLTFAFGAWLGRILRKRIEATRQYPMIEKVVTFVFRVFLYAVCYYLITSISLGIFIIFGHPLICTLVTLTVTFLLGFYLKKPGLLYCILFGLAFIALLEFYSTINAIFPAHVGLMRFSLPVEFLLTTWLGMIARKRIERNKETELANP